MKATPPPPKFGEYGKTTSPFPSLKQSSVASLLKTPSNGTEGSSSWVVSLPRIFLVKMQIPWEKCLPLTTSSLKSWESSHPRAEEEPWEAQMILPPFLLRLLCGS